MRISSLQVFQNGVRNIQTGQTNIANIQNQISTGQKLLRPSDDPVAAAQILKIRRELETNEVQNENITVAERRLSLQELTLQQINDAGDRIKELAIQANNSSLQQQDRAGIANEIKEVQNFILGLMNTKDAQGEYLFAGAKGQTQPFSESSPGVFSYQGDSEPRFIQVGPETFIKSTDTGQEIFQSIEGDPVVNVVSGGAASLQNLTLEVADKAAFKAATTALGLSTAASGVITLRVTGNDPVANTYDIQVEAADGTVLATETGIAMGSPHNLTVAAAGDPLGITTGTALGLSINPETLPSGGEYDIQPDVPKTNLLNTAQALIDGLTNATTSDEVNRIVSKALGEIDEGQNGVVRVQSQIGGRLNGLENQRGLNEEFELFNRAALSNLEDLDYAEALSEFSFQEVALQAAQQTFSRVNSLSLFNFL
ncbi:flagellar hook-associated protein FlgL [Motiliproteus sediminis]|uniref:flagellar hook-associated protein FlgL n=1 Tax=Motiliproteus sediminis TaxID=1468178 RepID=UPI001AF01C96|nr:flagellar hook-associated protein FlgL [Motiliproteus sediminis]